MASSELFIAITCSYFLLWKSINFILISINYYLLFSHCFLFLFYINRDSVLSKVSDPEVKKSLNVLRGKANDILVRCIENTF